jgi:hypothetical protein
VRRAIVTLGALVACAALGSAAWAQTPAQMAKYQAQYAKNYTTYQNYLMTHNGMPPFSAGQGTAYNPYLSGYQGYPGVYPGATQPLASNPIMALVSPFLGNYSGAQNYAGAYGGYGGAVVPPYQAPYVGAAYPAGPQYGDGDDDGFAGHRHHHCHLGGGGASYGPYGGGGYGQYGSGGYAPYGSGAYGPYNSAGYVPYGGRGYGPYGATPVSQALGHHHFNRSQFFNANAGGPGRGWGSRPLALMGGARRWGRHH